MLCNADLFTVKDVEGELIMIPDSRRKERTWHDPPMPKEQTAIKGCDYKISWSNAAIMIAVIVIVYLIGRQYGVFY